MAKKKPKQPLESFDPRFIQLLLKGGRERVVIPFLGPGGKGKATAMRTRLHTLRARMRDNNHDQATNVARAHLRILWGRKALEEGLVSDPTNEPIWAADDLGTAMGAFLVLQPRDIEFSEALETALGSAPATVPEQPTTEGDLSLDQLLDDLPKS